MLFASRLALILIALFAATASPASASGTVAVGISGAGKVVANGIDCERAAGAAATGTCAARYEGTLNCTPPPRPTCKEIPAIVELTAHDTGKGFAFDTWSGACAGRDPVCTLPVTRDFDVTAVFRDIQDPSLTFAGVTPTVRGTVTLAANANDNGGVARVDFTLGGQTISDHAAPYSATFNTATLKEGAATVLVTAVDTSGRTTSAPATGTVIDNVAPAAVVTGPNGAAFGPGATQAWTIQSSDATTGVKSVACSVVAGGMAPSFAPCSGGPGSHSVSGKPHGAYVFTARVIDNAGNVTDVARAFSVDTIAPSTTIASGVGDGASTADTTLTWAFSASEPGVAYECRVYPAALTPGAFAPCSNGAGHTAAGFAPGTYAFEVRATDAAANVEATPVKRTFTVAATPPPVVVPDPATPATITPGNLSSAAKSGGTAPQIRVSMTFTFSSSTKKQTKLTSLLIRDVPAGSTVSAKGFKKTNASGTVSLKSLLKKPYKAGATITVTISHPAMSTAIKTLKILPRKSPVVSTQCQPAGTKPKAC